MSGDSWLSQLGGRESTVGGGQEAAKYSTTCKPAPQQRIIYRQVAVVPRLEIPGIEEGGRKIIN